MISERAYNKLLKSLPPDGIGLLQQKFRKSKSQIYRDLRNGEINVVAHATEMATIWKESIATKKRKTDHLLNQL